MGRPGDRQVPQGSGEQRKLGETGCEVICDDPTIPLVKGYVKVRVNDLISKWTHILVVFDSTLREGWLSARKRTSLVLNWTCSSMFDKLQHFLREGEGWLSVKGNLHPDVSNFLGEGMAQYRKKGEPNVKVNLTEMIDGTYSVARRRSNQEGLPARVSADSPFSTPVTDTKWLTHEWIRMDGWINEWMVE